jgi:hypothetical protein
MGRPLHVFALHGAHVLALALPAQSHACQLLAQVSFGTIRNLLAASIRGHFQLCALGGQGSMHRGGQVASLIASSMGWLAQWLGPAAG